MRASRSLNRIVRQLIQSVDLELVFDNFIWLFVGSIIPGEEEMRQAVAISILTNKVSISGF